jgi:hypothetical protein
MKEYRRKNPDRVNATARKSRWKHRDKANARAKAWFLKNRERALAASANRRKNKPRTVKNEKLKSSFGITIEQYDAIAANQNHQCALCGIPQAEQRKQMAVDHDHVTGKVRALLCHNCNVGLGNFKDSEQILTKAIKYLYDHRNSKNSNDNSKNLTERNSNHGCALQRGRDQTVRDA